MFGKKKKGLIRIFQEKKVEKHKCCETPILQSPTLMDIITTETGRNELSGYEGQS
jgi:hypothetical protein